MKDDRIWKYMQEGFKPLPDAPDRYYIHEDGRVLSLIANNREPLLMKRGVSHEIERYNLSLKDHKRYASVNMIRYCALNGCSLESLRGHYIIISAEGVPVKLDVNEMSTHMQRKKGAYFPPKGDRQTLNMYRVTFEAQMRWYEQGDINGLMDIVQKTRPVLFGYLRKQGLGERNARNLADETISVYLERICRYTFVSVNLQKYLYHMAKRMLKEYYVKKKKLKDCQEGGEQYSDCKVIF